MTVKSLLSLGVVSLLLLQATCSPAPSGDMDSSYCQGIVERMEAAPTPRNPDMEFLRGLAEGTVEGFDVQEYLSILSHLSMEEGYILDYNYFLEEDFGGLPFIHARPSEYATYSEYIDAEYDGEAPEDRFSGHIQTDGSAEGFFELVVLRQMGNRFYLYWHAASGESTILCNKSSLQDLFDNLPTLPSDVQRIAQTLDLEPVVEISEKTVLVKIVIFSQWGGFIQESYTISRDFPHEIFRPEQETLVEYNSGIQF